MSQNGKGSKPRPLSVSYNKYADNFDNIKGMSKNKPLQDKPTKKDKQK
jgi:hypothetical protein